MPVMLLDEERLMVASGSDLLVHELEAPHDQPGGKVVGSIMTCAMQRRATPLDDITGLAVLPDGQVVVSTLRGVIRRARLLSRKRTEGALPPYSLAPAEITAHYTPASPPETAVETLTSCGSTILSAARDSVVSLYNAHAPWSPPTTITVDARPWSSLLALDNGGGLAAIGSSGTDPLQVFSVSNSRIAPQPLAILGGPAKRSAVYSVVQPPPGMAMPYTHHPAHLMLSAWYDGHARIHDLRTPAARLGAVITMSDPWSDSSLYSCGFTGPGWVVAGGARHGLVHFWDPRMTGLEGKVGGRTSGWSAFAPGRPESPVYELRSEGSRVWGVMSESAFVMAFDTAGEEGAQGAQGWDVVPSSVRVPTSTELVGDRRKKPGAGRTVWTRQDWSTGYRHEDRSVRLFDSLGAGK